MAEIGSLSVSLTLDSSNFNGSLSQVDRNLRSMGSELKAVKAKGADYGKSLEGLKEKQNVLSRSVEAAGIKLSETRKKYDEMKASGTASEVQMERMAKKVNDAQAQYNRLNSELQQVDEQLRIQSSSWTQLSQRLAPVGQKFTDIGNSMSQLGSNLTMKVTAPLVAMGTAASKVAIDFEAQMDRVGAIAGATGDEMSKMEKQALDLGASTSKSASEVAVGMENMAAMGFNVNEIMAAMPGVISAAEASGSDMAQTADVMASTLNIFGMEASKASYVADVLAQTANQSAADITDMQYALKYAGPPAASLGVTLEELSSAIGIMTNAGMGGEQAGTTLRAALLSLLNPSEKNIKLMNEMGVAIKDANNNFVGLSPLIQNLQDSMGGMTETQKAATLAQLVGTEAVSGMLSLMKAGPAEIDKMTQALRNSGGASAETAKKMKDNLKGTLEELGGTIETAAITIGNTLAPSIKKASEQIQGMVEKFQKLSPETQKTILAIGGIVAAAGPLLVIGGTIMSGIGGTITAVSTLTGAIGAAGGLTAALTAISGPIGWTVAGIALLTGGIIAVKAASSEATEVNLQHAESLIKQQQELEGLSTRYDELSSKNKLSNDELMRFRDIQSGLDIATSAAEVAKLKDEQAQLQEKSGLTNEEMAEMLSLNDKIIETAPNVDKVYSDRGNAIIANRDALEEVNGELRDNIALELENQRSKSEANLDENIRKHIEAIDELKAKQQELNAAEQERDSLAQTILDLKIQKQSELNSGKEYEAEQTAFEILQQESLLVRQNKKVSKITDEVTEKMKSRDETQKEIDKTIELYNQLINVQLQRSGINAEGEKGIAILDSTIAKTQARVNTLLLIAQSQGGLNEQQQREYDILVNQLGVYQSSKSEIQNIQKEQSGVNGKIDEATGKAKNMNSELGKGVKKDVNVDDKGKAKEISKEAEKSATKPVTFKGVNNIWDLIPKTLSVAINFIGKKIAGNAKGTSNWGGGLSWLAEAGRELTYTPGSGLALISEPSLVNLPRGAKVIPNRETEEILRRWNVPAFASGTNHAPGGLAYVAEQGRELVDFGSRTTAQNREEGNTFTIVPSDVVLDKQVLGRIVYEVVKGLQQTDALKTRKFGGDPLV